MAAQSDGVNQIWVAAGTYTPQTAPAGSTDTRDKTFLLVKDVKIYGGFAGTETTLADRDAAHHVSTLDGVNNCYHVVTSVGDVGTACLDGFTLTGGNANVATNFSYNGLSIVRNQGGGVFCNTSSPALANLIITGNAAANGGGIMLNLGSKPTLTNVLIAGNTAGGSGMSGVVGGGGMFNNTNDMPTLINVTITGNSTTAAGGGMFNQSGSAPALHNTIIWGNTASASGNNMNAVLGTADYSLVQDYNLTGSGNLDGTLSTNNPQFADPNNSQFSILNYQLKQGSPCIDKGNNSYNTFATDLAGNPRIVGVIDMGAFEYRPQVSTYFISASPTTLNFGSLQTPYTQPTAQTVTISNTGTGSVTLTQPTATNYVLNLAPLNLAPGASATLTMQPKAGLSAGTHNKTITINGNNGASATVSVNFTVTDAGTAAGSTISATYNGIPVATGAVLPRGNQLVITAAPAGTGSVFTYTWSGAGTNGETTAALTIASLTGTVNATCTVTGVTSTTTYSVSIGTFANGTVSADKISAAEGETVTLTIAPAAGYELNTITATGSAGAVALSVPNVTTRTFTMPSSNVTVTATFTKTQATLDAEAVEAAKDDIEGGTYRVAETTANTKAEVIIWLVNTLNDLFGQLHNTLFRASVPSVVGDVTVISITPAIAGTEANPAGTNGSFTYTVTLTAGSTTLTTSEMPGVIVATPFEAARGIELQLNKLTVTIINTGNAATGDLTLTLSGDNADAFTLPAATVSSLAVGGEAKITLTPKAGLAAGTYKATLTVSGEGLTAVSVEITYTETGTGIDNPHANSLEAYVQNGTLHISGLTAGKLWSLYGIAGTLVYQGVANSAVAEINLPVQGVYIVKSVNQTVKVLY